MADDYKTGLDEQDDLSQFPSAANPLTAMGLDPDEVRANPGILDRLTNGNTPVGGDRQQRVPYAPVSRPSLNDVSAPPPSAAPSTSGEPTDAEGYGMAGLKSLNESMQQATKATGEVPTQTPEEITKLSERRSHLATPAPRFDKTTGKELTSTQEYDPDTGQMVTINPKASTGQKVWRGVRGGLVGLMTGGIPGAVTGAIEPQDIAGGKAYNAPSKQYDQAEQRREQALGTTDTEIDNARKNWKEAVDASKAKAGDLRANAALGKYLTAGATGLINAEDNKPEAEQRKADAKLQLSQKEFDLRGQQADRLRLTGVQRSLYIANGKLPDPRQATEGELALAQATKAFIKQNGHPPQTLDEFNEVAQSAKGTYGKEDSKQDSIDAANLRASMRASEQHLKTLQALLPHVFDPQAKADLQEKIKDAETEFKDLQDQLQGKQKPAAAGPTPPAVTQAIASVPKPAAPAELRNTPAPVPTKPTTATSATKPQPAPDGTRRQAPDGTVEVKQGGKWVKEQA